MFSFFEEFLGRDERVVLDPFVGFVVDASRHAPIPALGSGDEGVQGKFEENLKQDYSAMNAL